MMTPTPTDLFHQSSIIRVLRSMQGSMGIKKVFHGLIEGLRKETFHVISREELSEVDTILEFNTMFLKDVELGNFITELGCKSFKDITDETQTQLVKLQLKHSLEQKKNSSKPNSSMESKAVRTLRDTIYRLQKEQVLPDDFEKDGTEVLYKHDHRVKILLEKRMANNRATQKRYIIFQLPIATLENLLGTHPSDFLSEVDKLLKEATRLNSFMKPNDWGATSSQNREGDLKEMSLTSQNHQFTLTGTGDPVLDINDRIELLNQICTKVYGIQTDEELQLLLKLVALR